MKKTLLSAVLILGALNSFASHMMGGQITAKNTGGLTYEVTTTFYRDMFGINLPPSVNLVYTDPLGGQTTSTVPMTTSYLFGNDVEVGVYTETITLASAGTYYIRVTECCRNAAVLNIPNASSYDFHIQTILFADPTNSSPEFLNPPIPLAQLNVPFNYNPLPFDADGDSIVWALDTPMYGVATLPGQYVSGYVLPPSDPLFPFTMDAQTGEISFLPNTQGNFQVSCLIDEYRNGNLIGQIRRDMQIIVLTSPNIPPAIVSSSGNPPYSGNSYTIAPGTALSLSVIVDDPDGSTPTVTGFGEPFLISNAASLTTSSVTTGSVTANVGWTPSVAEERTTPYLMALRVADAFSTNTFISDVSFVITVSSVSSLNEHSDKMVSSVYPNPSDGNFTLEIRSDKQQTVTLSIANMMGQQVKTFNHDLIAGTNLINVRNLNLPKGNYLLNVMNERKVVETKTININ